MWLLHREMNPVEDEADEGDLSPDSGDDEPDELDDDSRLDQETEDIMNQYAAFLTFFWELDTERQNYWPRSPIPYSAICRMMNHFGCTDTGFIDSCAHIFRCLDNAFMQWEREKMARDEEERARIVRSRAMHK